MLYIDDHRPALMGLSAVLIGSAAHAAMPDNPPYETLELVKLWLSVIGQGVAILAGLASFAWYAYSIYKKKTDDGSSNN